MLSDNFVALSPTHGTHVNDQSFLYYFYQISTEDFRYKDMHRLQELSYSVVGEEKYNGPDRESNPGPSQH